MPTPIPSPHFLVPVGGYYDLPIPSAPCTLCLYPTSGDTLKVEQSFNGTTINPNPVKSGITVEDTTVFVARPNFIRVTNTAGTSGTSYFTAIWN